MLDSIGFIPSKLTLKEFVLDIVGGMNIFVEFGCAGDDWNGESRNLFGEGGRASVGSEELRFIPSIHDGGGGAAVACCGNIFQ